MAVFVFGKHAARNYATERYVQRYVTCLASSPRLVDSCSRWQYRSSAPSWCYLAPFEFKPQRDIAHSVVVGIKLAFSRRANQFRTRNRQTRINYGLLSSNFSHFALEIWRKEKSRSSAGNHVLQQLTCDHI